MSHRQNPPRQHRPNVGRSPVKRHSGVRSVATEKQRRAMFAHKGKTGLTDQQQAGLYYERKTNSAGRPPLA